MIPCTGMHKKGEKKSLMSSIFLVWGEKIGKDARSRIYLPHFEGEPSTEPMNAIEVAISGRAKHFLSNPLVQEIISMDMLFSHGTNGLEQHHSVD